MKILIERYYGDVRITKSILTVTMADGTEWMRCEAREGAFADYDKKFCGCSNFCLAKGEHFQVKPRCRVYGPMTLCIQHAPGRLSCPIGWDLFREWKAGEILIGYGNPDVPAESRRLEHQQEAFDRLTEGVYKAFCQGEDIEASVTNEKILNSQFIN